MARFNQIGHCKKCGFQWVIKGRDAIYRTRGRGESGDKRRSIQCPLCRHGDIRIEKEDLNESE